MTDHLSAFLRLHQETLFYAFATFCFGVFAGIQAVMARNPLEYRMAFRTVSAVCYMAIRGSLPAVIYLVLHKTALLSFGSVHPLLEALVLGFGSEGFLRSRILLGFKTNALQGTPTEATAGPLDFVRWLQEFFLGRTAKSITPKRIVLVKHYYQKPGLIFRTTYQSLLIHLAALGPSDNKERLEAERLSGPISAEYEAKLALLPPGGAFPPAVETQYCLTLGYALYAALEPTNFAAISKVIT